MFSEGMVQRHGDVATTTVDIADNVATLHRQLEFYMAVLGLMWQG